MSGLFNNKIYVEEQCNLHKPIEVQYNNFYKQMRLLRTTIEKNDDDKKNISITGVVVLGNGNDTRLFYPTANISIKVNESDTNGLVVRNGSYIANLVCDKHNYNAVAFVNNALVKTHIIDFNENIIGKRIKVRFIQFLRPVEEFATTQDLVDAIGSDVFLAKDYFLSQKLEKMK